MMSKVILESDLRAKLNGLNEQLEICDETGRTLGRFLPEEVYRRLSYALADATCPHSQEELERRSNEPGAMPLAEFWRSLGAK
jgi:hypothetical protein